MYSVLLLLLPPTKHIVPSREIHVPICIVVVLSVEVTYKYELKWNLPFITFTADKLLCICV